MKVKIASISLGFAMLALSGSAGIAGGDWNDGGIRNYSNSVPVPAPIPVPLYSALWYFRVDGGFGFGSDGDASESGMSFGSPITVGGSAYSTTPYGSDDSWISSGFTNNSVWNLGVGYYWTRKLRTDLTAELRRSQDIDIQTSTSSALFIGGAPGAPGDTYNVQVDDRTIMRGGVFMLNAYYDFDAWGPLRPYIGGGVGFGYTDLERRNDTTVSAFAGGSTIELLSSSTTDHEKATSAALSAMFGFTYDLTEITQLDVGYRFLWVEGVNINVPSIGSKLELDDTFEHQIRVGLRFNVF